MRARAKLRGRAAELEGEILALRDRVALDATIKVGSPQWVAAVARCEELRAEIAARKRGKTDAASRPR